MTRTLVVVAVAVVLVSAESRQESLGEQVSGRSFSYEVPPGESLISIASRFGIDVPVIAKANGLKSQARLAPGQSLQLDNRHIVPPRPDGVGLLINVPQRMLFFWEDGALAGAWPVALGRPGWRTPLGEFQVLSKETDPTWDVPPSIQEEMRQKGQPVLTKVPPCPDNPLGKFWIGTSLSGVGIHGTPAPTSIYRHVTHGCIRLHPDSIAALFPRVTVGLAGRIAYVPVLLARTPEGIFVEAHRDVYRRERGDPMTALRVLAHDAAVAAEIDWKAAHDVLRRREGIARRVGPALEPTAGR